MKFHLLYVLTLCVCLRQIFAESPLNVDEIEEVTRERIYAVGDQFVDDLVKISAKYKNNDFVPSVLYYTILEISGLPKKKNSKIDVNEVMKNETSTFSRAFSNAEIKAIKTENLMIFQSILSQQFPPERYNGVVNMIFVFVFDYATTEEIQSALNYLYGVDSEATKTSFLESHNISTLTSKNDCPGEYPKLSVHSSIDALRSMLDVKPKVMQDFLAIRNKFPCNENSLQSLKHFVYIIQRLGGSERKINACMIKESPGNWNGNRHVSRDVMEHDLDMAESILSTRLPDETIRGIINFKRATIPGTSIAEIEKSLEYLYDDVPKTECPETENSL